MFFNRSIPDRDYPVRCFIEGDEREGMGLWVLAVKRLFDLRRENILDLPIYWNQLRLKNGGYILCETNFGIETIRIYAPPSITHEHREVVREKTIHTVMPAFEAYDSSNRQIGYVICRGGTWDGPYQLIETDRVIDPWLTRDQAESVWGEIAVEVYPFQWPIWKAYAGTYNSTCSDYYSTLALGSYHSKSSPYLSDIKQESIPIADHYQDGEGKVVELYEIVCQAEDVTAVTNNVSIDQADGQWTSGIHPLWGSDGIQELAWWVCDYMIDRMTGTKTRVIVGDSGVELSNMESFDGSSEYSTGTMSTQLGYDAPTSDTIDFFSSHTPLDAIGAINLLYNKFFSFSDIINVDYQDDYSNFLEDTKGAALWLGRDTTSWERRVRTQADYPDGFWSGELTESETITSGMTDQYSINILVNGDVYTLHTSTSGMNLSFASARYYDPDGSPHVLACNMEQVEGRFEYIQVRPDLEGEDKCLHNVHFPRISNSLGNCHEIPGITASDGGPVYGKGTYRLVREIEKRTERM